MNNDNFFPSDDYEIPTASNYMKFSDGDNSFRALSSAVVGWEYWRVGENGKEEPVRSKTPFTATPDIKLNDGKPSKVSHFWAFVVWNYNAKKIQILEITQKKIQSDMQSIIKNPKWGSPVGYDIKINRTGKGLETKYSVTPEPHSVIDPAIKDAYDNSIIDLEKLFTNDDPFTN